MSKEAGAYVRNAREAHTRAMKSEGEYRDLMEAVAEAYNLLAFVQMIIDDPRGQYEPPQRMH
ncbi:MAG: hypothetical protein JO000_00630 [Alphaproteobacteria bacterium]|nr:hypothetical protein [Alphaproteobacteria bacterium]